MKLSLFPEEESAGGAAALTALREKAAVCQKCPLWVDRTHVVMGEGNVNSPRIAFIGEAPGPAEDVEGRPFVGKAGQLLDLFIDAMGVRREEVYLCNAIGCRTPSGRKPDVDEIKACSEYLEGQLRVVRPELIVALGSSAASALTGTKKNVKDLRGRWLDWKDKKTGHSAKVRVTYHPAYVLRKPNKKEDVWSDLQMVMKWLA